MSCKPFWNFVLRTSFKNTAKMIGSGNVKMILYRLMMSVFAKACWNSDFLNTCSKYLKPAHGLSKMERNGSPGT